MNRLVCMLLLLSAVACNKKQEELSTTNDNPYPGYREYLIPAKQHYATTSIIQFVQQKEMHFLALFDSTCMYNSTRAENASDINKLYGFSDCGSMHHENSARVGWLWNGKLIELYGYCYSNGTRNNVLLGTINIGVSADLSISVLPNKYQFTYNGAITTLPRHCTTESIEGYRLYPYFGGDETAPHDIHVFIKDL